MVNGRKPRIGEKIGQKHVDRHFLLSYQPVSLDRMNIHAVGDYVVQKVYYG